MLNTYLKESFSLDFGIDRSLAETVRAFRYKIKRMIRIRNVNVWSYPTSHLVS
jgi:hypothetical protein